MSQEPSEASSKLVSVYDKIQGKNDQLTLRDHVSFQNRELHLSKHNFMECVKKTSSTYVCGAVS